METKKFTRLTMLLALSIVLNIVESMFPISYIPGLRLGLANIITLFIIYKYSFKDAIYVSVLRVIIAGLLQTGIFSPTFFFSLTGAILSTIMMYICHRFTKLSIIGVSIVGSIFHSVGQVLVSILILNSLSMIYYLPYLLLFSIPTGIIVGLLCKEIVYFFSKDLLLNKK